jgi:indole-3-glycerol phosphate synthase
MREHLAVTSRRLSQAISEGEGISLIARVDGPEAARAAEEQGADAVAVRTSVPDLRESTRLPIIWAVYGDVGDAKGDGADAYVIGVGPFEEAEERYLETRLRTATDAGLECVFEVGNSDSLDRVLELVDPEVLLLNGGGPTPDAFENLLELLSEVPAGKLVIAALEEPTPEDVRELERVGVDAVLVESANIQGLADAEPPDV